MPEYRLTFIIEGKDRASGPLSSVAGGLQRVAEFAAGDLLAGGIRKIGQALFDLGRNAVSGTGELQNMRIALETLSAREAVLAGAFDTVEEAMRETAGTGSVLLDRLRELSIASPFEYEQIANTFRLNLAFGASSDAAADLAKGLLDVGAGLGMTNDVLDRTSYNLAQAVVAGDLTAANLRQLKMVGIDLAGVLRDELGLSVEQVTQQLRQGKITLADVSQAFVDYAEKNFGGAAERMSRTFQGLQSSIKDLFFFASADLLTPALDEVSGALSEVFDQARGIIDSGVLREIGAELGHIAQAGIQAGRDFADRFGGKMVETAENALRWGINISTELATGLIQGAVWALTSAMDVIGDILAYFLQGHSPPRVAPHMNDWGAEAMTEFLRGFTDAEWGVMDDVRYTLESVLRTLVDSGQMAADALGPTMIGLTRELASALSEYARTGVVSEGLFSRLAGVGGVFGDELERLARLQFSLVDATRTYQAVVAQLAAAKDKERKSEESLLRLGDEYNELLAHRAPMRDVRAKKAELEAARQAHAQAQKERSEAEQAVQQAQEKRDALSDQAAWQQLLIEQLRQMAEWNTRALEPERAPGRIRAPKIGGAMPSFPIPDWTGPLQQAVDEITQSDVMTKIKDLFAPVREAWEGPISDALQKLQDKWIEFKDILVAAWNSPEVLAVREFLADLFPEGTLETIGKWVGAILVGAAAVGILAAVISIVINPLFLLGAGIAILAGLWTQHGEEIMVTTRQLGFIIKHYFGVAWKAVRKFAVNAWNTIVGFFVDLWTKVRLYSQMLDAILFYGLHKLSVQIRDFIEDVVAFFVNLYNRLIGEDSIIPGMLADIQQSFRETFTGLIQSAGEWIDGIVDKIRTRIDAFVQIGKDLVEGLKEGLRGKFLELEGFVGDLMSRLPRWVKDLLGIHSPSAIFAEIGTDIMRGLAQGMANSIRLPSTQMQTSVRNTVAAAQGSPFSPRPNAVYIYGDIHLPGVRDAHDLLSQLQQYAIPGS